MGPERASSASHRNELHGERIGLVDQSGEISNVADDFRERCRAKTQRNTAFGIRRIGIDHDIHASRFRASGIVLAALNSEEIHHLGDGRFSEGDSRNDSAIELFRDGCSSPTASDFEGTAFAGIEFWNGSFPEFINLT